MVAIVATAGFVVGLLIPRSQASAGLDETEPALVVAQVESRVVEEVVVLQGRVMPGERTEVIYTPGSDGDVIPYVTAVGPKAGENLLSGSLLLAVADKPHIALHVDYPLYRSLRVGDTGSDVLAFETALARHVSGDFDVDNLFTENTMEAAAELWQRLGYELPTEPATQPPLEMPTTGPSTPGSPAPTSSAPTAAEPIRHQYVDVHEIVQLASDAAVVVENAAVGDLATQEGPIAVVTGAKSYISARVSLLYEADFAPGAYVTVSTSSLPEIDVAVSELGDLDLEAEESQGAQGAGRDAIIPLPSDWGNLPEGTSVTVSPSSSKEPGLALPLTAVRDASSNPYVIVEQAANYEVGARVNVEILTTGDGWAEIGASSALGIGDKVRLTP